MNAEEYVRFLARVKKTENCWLWTGQKNTAGYGLITVSRMLQRAHRVAYEHFKSPIPKGLVIDHLCRTRNCVNPNHLEPVTIKENTRRGTSAIARRMTSNECIKGHEYTYENTGYRGNGKYPMSRVCKICRRISFLKYKGKQR